MFSRRTMRRPCTALFHTAVRTVFPSQEMSRGRPTLTDNSRAMIITSLQMQSDDDKRAAAAMEYTQPMTARDPPDNFLAAFSFAGGPRELVRPVAERLEHPLGPSSVFFDEWFEHSTAGHDGDLRLQEIYGKRC